MEDQTETPQSAHARDLPVVPTSEMLGDDAEVERKRKVPDALVFCDDQFITDIMRHLNTMRKNKQFCDVILKVGKQEIAGHRCVLAASSQYLLKRLGEERAAGNKEEVFKLSDSLDCEATEALVEFAYTGRLFVHPSKVRCVYAAAVRLRMDQVARTCAHWLVTNLDTQSCLEIRAIPAVAGNAELVATVDQFIVLNFAELVQTKQLLKLPQIRVELLTPSALEELLETTMASHALLVLDWLRKHLRDANATLEESADKLHLLYLNTDNSLHDCSDIVTGDSQNTEMVQDYKKLSKRQVSRKSSPGVLSHSPNFSSSDASARAQDGVPGDWKTIACAKVDERGMVALVTLAGNLSVLCVRQRLNPPSPTSSPHTSRPPSLEKADAYAVMPELASAKCGIGVGTVDNKLIICGGYDRGECLREAELYDPITNKIWPIQPMKAARGRLDITVIDRRVYAVGGSDGNNELASVEMYNVDEDQWSPRAPLHMARSNLGVCALKGKIVCVGGWNGKFGSRKCETYDPVTNQWSPMTSLNTGRYQAAVTTLNGRVYAVGGCDSWNCLSSVELFDPEVDRWTFISPMSTPRRGAGVSRINGKLIVVGGLDGVHALNTTEIYDPETSTWSQGPKMLSRRANVNVAMVDGKLFAVGGFSGKQFLNSIEYLDPRTMTWSTCMRRRSRGMSGDSVTSSEEDCPVAVTTAAPPETPTFHTAFPEEPATPDTTEEIIKSPLFTINEKLTADAVNDRLNGEAATSDDEKVKVSDDVCLHAESGSVEYHHVEGGAIVAATTA